MTTKDGENEYGILEGTHRYYPAPVSGQLRFVLPVVSATAGPMF
jgi:hypothetical protein